MSATCYLGHAIWKRGSGRHTKQARCENAMPPALCRAHRSLSPDRQAAEFNVGIALINFVNAFGTAQSRRLAQSHR